MTTLYEDELDTDLLHEMRHHQKVLDKQGVSARNITSWTSFGALLLLGWAYNSGDLIPAITAIGVLLIRICIGLDAHKWNSSNLQMLATIQLQQISRVSRIEKDGF